MTQQVADRSNGWNDIAGRFMAVRSPTIGVATVRKWAVSLPAGGAVLDLGCGHGVPIAQALLLDGIALYGVDASPLLVAEFRKRFPATPVKCEAVEESDFFDRTFDGVIAVGLVFLLEENVQRELIARVASVLNPDGRFLFTAPTQKAAWLDSLTQRQSLSLGDEAYRAILSVAGFAVVAEYEDEGGIHYYDAARVAAANLEQR